MTEVSMMRLYLLRALYALICFGEGSRIWPLVFHHGQWSMMHSVAIALLAAFTALCALGIRYPLQMLPLLLFEVLWKTIWLTAIALPLWRTNQLNGEMLETTRDTLVVVIIPFILPWGYIWANYVKKPGDRWTVVRKPTSA
ncbi:MAG: hypothetical protein ABR582_01900 [Gemmatimonadaceae bacterium]